MGIEICYQTLENHFVVEVGIRVLHENVKKGVQNVLQEFDCLLAVHFHQSRQAVLQFLRLTRPF